MTDTRPWYKHFWPWFLIALLMIVIMACFYTVYLALNNPLSMVKEDYYKEGLAINQNQQRSRKASELKMVARCFLAEGKIQCKFFSGRDLPGEKPVRLQFIHPLDSSRDLHFSLHQMANSVYHSDILTPSILESLRKEKRWYIYLEVVEGDWLLETESSFHEENVISLGESRDG